MLVSATKIEGNTTSIINCYFFKIFTLPHTKLTIYMKKNKSNSYNLFSLGLTSLEMQRVLQTKFFYSVFTETIPKPSKVVTAKKLFLQCVSYGYNLL